MQGFDGKDRLGIQFDNVVFDSPGSIRIAAAHADIKQGPGPFNLQVAGDDVVVSGTPGQAPRNACMEKFVDFPSK